MSELKEVIESSFQQLKRTLIQHGFRGGVVVAVLLETDEEVMQVVRTDVNAQQARSLISFLTRHLTSGRR